LSDGALEKKGSKIESKQLTWQKVSIRQDTNWGKGEKRGRERRGGKKGAFDNRSLSESNIFRMIVQLKKTRKGKNIRNQNYRTHKKSDGAPMAHLLQPIWTRGIGWGKRARE